LYIVRPVGEKDLAKAGEHKSSKYRHELREKVARFKKVWQKGRFEGH